MPNKDSSAGSSPAGRRDRRGGDTTITPPNQDARSRRVSNTNATPSRSRSAESSDSMSPPTKAATMRRLEQELFETKALLEVKEEELHALKGILEQFMSPDEETAKFRAESEKFQAQIQEMSEKLEAKDDQQHLQQPKQFKQNPNGKGNDSDPDSNVKLQIHTLEMSNKTLKAKVQELKESLAARNQQAEMLQETVLEKDKRIKDLQEALAERDEIIEKLHDTSKDNDSRLGEDPVISPPSTKAIRAKPTRNSVSSLGSATSKKSKKPRRRGSNGSLLDKLQHRAEKLLKAEEQKRQEEESRNNNSFSSVNMSGVSEDETSGENISSAEDNNSRGFMNDGSARMNDERLQELQQQLSQLTEDNEKLTMQLEAATNSSSRKLASDASSTGPSSPAPQHLSPLTNSETFSGDSKTSKLDELKKRKTIAKKEISHIDDELQSKLTRIKASLEKAEDQPDHNHSPKNEETLTEPHDAQQLSEKLSTLQSELTAKATEIQQLQEHLSKMKDEVTAKDTIIQQLKKSSKDADRDLEVDETVHVPSVEDKLAKSATGAASSTQLEEILVKKDEELSEQSDMILRLKESLSKSEDEHAETDQFYQASMEEMQTKKRQAESQLEALQSQLSHLETLNQELQAELEEVQQDYRGKESSCGALQAQIETLQLSLSTKEDAFKEELETLKREVAANETALQEALEAELNQLQTKMSQKDATIRHLREEIETMKQDLDSKQLASKDLHAAMKELQKELEGKVEMLERDLQKKEASAVELQSALEASQRDIANTQALLEESQRETNSIRSLLDESQPEHSESSDAAELLRLQGELKAKDAAAAELKAAMKDLQKDFARVDELETKIEELEEELRAREAAAMEMQRQEFSKTYHLQLQLNNAKNELAMKNQAMQDWQAHMHQFNTEFVAQDKECREMRVEVEKLQKQLLKEAEKSTALQEEVTQLQNGIAMRDIAAIEEQEKVDKRQEHTDKLQKAVSADHVSSTAASNSLQKEVNWLREVVTDKDFKLQEEQQRYKQLENKMEQLQGDATTREDKESHRQLEQLRSDLAMEKSAHHKLSESFERLKEVATKNEQICKGLQQKAENRCHELNEKVEALQSKSTAQKQEIDTLNSDIARLGEEIADKNSTILQKEGDIEGATATLKQLSWEATDLRSKLLDADLKLSSQVKENEKLRQVNVGLSEEVENHKRDLQAKVASVVDSMRVELHVKETTIQDLAKQIEDLQQEGSNDNILALQDEKTEVVAEEEIATEGKDKEPGSTIDASVAEIRSLKEEVVKLTAKLSQSGEQSTAGAGVERGSFQTSKQPLLANETGSTAILQKALYESSGDIDLLKIELDRLQHRGTVEVMDGRRNKSQQQDIKRYAAEVAATLDTRYRRHSTNGDENLLQGMSQLKETSNARTGQSENNAGTYESNMTISTESPSSEDIEDVSSSARQSLDELKAELGNLKAVLSYKQKEREQSPPVSTTESVASDNEGTEHLHNIETRLLKNQVQQLTSTVRRQEQEAGDLREQLASFKTEGASRNHDRAEQLNYALPQMIANNLQFLVRPAFQQQLSEVIHAIAGDDVSLVNEGLSELATILNKEQEGDCTRVSFFRAHGHVIVMNAMIRYQVHAGLQEECCRVISSMCLFSKSISFAGVGGIGNICLGLASLGAFDCIFGAMNMFPNDAGLQKHAFRALNNLLSVRDLLGLFFSSADVFRRLSVHMSNFPEDTTLQEDGCRILRFSGSNARGRAAMKKEGALRVLASIMERFDESSSTYKQALKAWRAILLGE